MYVRGFPEKDANCSEFRKKLIKMKVSKLNSSAFQRLGDSYVFFFLRKLSCNYTSISQNQEEANILAPGREGGQVGQLHGHPISVWS